MKWAGNIPISLMRADLVQKIRWLRDHDDVARKIGEQGQALAPATNYDSELNGAAHIITVAMRHSRGRSEIELRFAPGAAATTCLQEGWSSVLDDGVPASGFESRLRLPCLVTDDDFVLSLDMSPVADPSAPVAQRVSVVVNGAVTLESPLTDR